MSIVGVLLNHRYEVIKKIGEGGMSTVFYVKDHRLQKYWAMKKVRKVQSRIVDAFENEVKMMSRFQHKGIPKCIDFFEDEEALYMVMEYIEATSLQDCQKYTMADVLQWMLEICDIFIYLHTGFQMTILYLDLKPQNILIDDRNHVHIIDFGSSCFIGHVSSVLTGTPRIYCS